MFVFAFQPAIYVKI